MAASNVTWLNSCVNPIIYAMMNTRFRKGKKFYKKNFQKFQKIILFKNQNILKCWSTWSKRERRIKVKNQCIVGSTYGSPQKPMYRIGIFCHVITFCLHFNQHFAIFRIYLYFEQTRVRLLVWLIKMSQNRFSLSLGEISISGWLDDALSQSNRCLISTYQSARNSVHSFTVNISRPKII